MPILKTTRKRQIKSKIQEGRKLAGKNTDRKRKLTRQDIGWAPDYILNGK